MSERYADQRGHDVAWMTAQERADHELAARELLAGYDAARRSHGDRYADYLIRHDTELAAKGCAVTPWPQSLQGNDGD